MRIVCGLVVCGLAAAASARSADPESEARVLFLHGMDLAKVNRFDEARAVFERGRRLYPADKRFPIELAGIAFREQKTAEAKSMLRAALRLDRQDEYGNEFLGSLYWFDGNLPAALKYWNRIGKPVLQEVAVKPPDAADDVLLGRAITISGGQVLTAARMRSTESNLDRLGIFADRRMELAPRSDSRFDLTLRLDPREPALGGWLGRVLPIASGLPYQAVRLDWFNLGRRAVNVQSLWRWDPDKRRITMGFGAPIRVSPRAGFRLGLDGRDERWEIADAGIAGLPMRKVEAGGDLVFAVGERVEWTTGLRVARRSFRNGGADAIFGGGWSFEQRNRLATRWWVSPERRVFAESAVTLRTGRVMTGATSRFAIFEGDLAASWWPQAKGDDWLVEARMRSGTTFGRAPFDHLFQLGMERDNELWLRGHVGTRDGRKGRAPLGGDYALLQTGVERVVLRLPLLRASAGPFFDAGWIAGPAGWPGSRGWLPDAGVQAKVRAAGRLTWTVVYGRDLRGGRGVFYTAVTR